MSVQESASFLIISKNLSFQPVTVLLLTLASARDYTDGEISLVHVTANCEEPTSDSTRHTHKFVTP